MYSVDAVGTGQDTPKFFVHRLFSAHLVEFQDSVKSCALRWPYCTKLAATIGLSIHGAKHRMKQGLVDKPFHNVPDFMKVSQNAPNI